jgi:ubiquinone/menaquinone biosynthesis C-methylase UbiE
MFGESFYNRKMANLRSRLFGKNVSGTEFNDYFFSLVGSRLVKGMKILDIGTGNGYVLSELKRRFPEYGLVFFGIDSSVDMVSVARGALSESAKVDLGSARRLPYESDSFDLITAKNVTSVNASEVMRTLKTSGYFIFREYGVGKGLVEVAKLFPKSRLIRSRSIDYYTEELQNAGLSVELAEQHEVVRTYALDTLLEIIRSYPFIYSFSETDEELVRNSLGGSEVRITSDPFVIIARKGEIDV